MKPFWKYTLAVLLVLGLTTILLFSLDAYLTATSNAELQQEITLIQAAGEVVYLDQAPRSDVPDDQNAAVYLRSMKDDLHAVNRALFEVKFYPPGDRPWSDEENATFKTAFELRPHLPEVIKRTADCSHYRPEVDFSSNLGHDGESLVLFRDVLRFTIHHALSLLADGRREEAVDQCLTMLKIARRMNDEPSIYSFQTICAVREEVYKVLNILLRDGPWPDWQYEDLESHLAAVDSPREFIAALKAERALFMTAYNRARSDPSALRDLREIDDRGGINIREWLGRSPMNFDQAFYLKAMNALIDAGDGPREDFLAVAEQSQVESDGWLHGHISGGILNHMDSSRQFYDRSLGCSRTLRLLNAWYQATRDDPDKAESLELSESALPTVTFVDPFTEKPLVSKRTAHGWLVYSVGRNLVDDGGKFDEVLDLGFGPARREENEQPVVEEPNPTETP